MRRLSTPITKRIVLLVWILVAALYFYVAYDYIRISMADSRLDSYLQYLVQLAGKENRPAKEIRQLIMVRAEELELPLRVEQISISGSGESLRIAVDYDVDVILPVLRRGFYPKHYTHKVNYHPAF